jgi:hypothetical protein
LDLPEWNSRAVLAACVAKAAALVLRVGATRIAVDSLFALLRRFV